VKATSHILRLDSYNSSEHGFESLQGTRHG